MYLFKCHILNGFLQANIHDLLLKSADFLAESNRFAGQQSKQVAKLDQVWTAVIQLELQRRDVLGQQGLHHLTGEVLVVQEWNEH